MAACSKHSVVCRCALYTSIPVHHGIPYGMQYYGMEAYTAYHVVLSYHVATPYHVMVSTYTHAHANSRPLQHTVPMEYMEGM